MSPEKLRRGNLHPLHELLRCQGVPILVHEHRSVVLWCGGLGPRQQAVTWPRNSACPPL